MDSSRFLMKPILVFISSIFMLTFFVVNFKPLWINLGFSLIANLINTFCLQNKLREGFGRIDKKIFTQLQVDGRTTVRDLAKIVGFTSMGTKKRLDKLIEKGTIKVSALINPSEFKLHPAIVMLEVRTQKQCKTCLIVSKSAHEWSKSSKHGGYNLIALVVAETPETLESISMEKCSLRSCQGIRRLNSIP